jgi:hypothetical protein
MKLLLSSCLVAALLFLLPGCVSDDEALAPRQDPAADGAAPVPGAATPAPNAHSGGWW